MRRSPSPTPRSGREPCERSCFRHDCSDVGLGEHGDVDFARCHERGKLGVVGVVGYLNVLLGVDSVCLEDVVENVFGRCALSGRAYFLPFKSATLLILSPFSSIESTPRVFTAIISPSRRSFIYRGGEIQRAGGNVGLALDYEGRYLGCGGGYRDVVLRVLSLMSLAMPMPVGPLRVVIFIGVVSAGTVSSVVVALSSVFPVHAAKLKPSRGTAAGKESL